MFLTPFQRGPRRREHVRGLLRAWGYLMALAAVSAFFSIRAARAEVAEEAMALGRRLGEQMREVLDGKQHEIHRLRVNGQDIFVASAISEASAKSVLDRFAGHCGDNLAQSPDEWRALSTDAGAAAEPGFGPGVIRSGGTDEGIVMCFVKNAASKPGLRDALESFLETGNLSALGDLRYAYAHKTKTGKTLVLTAWTHERFSVKDLVPDEGVDAAGEDFPELPRPPGSWRVMSVSAEGTGYGVNVYRTAAAPEQVASYYDAEMAKLGYRGGATMLPEEEHAIGHAYVKDGVMMTVAIHTEGKHTFVTSGFSGVQAGLGARGAR